MLGNISKSKKVWGIYVGETSISAVKVIKTPKSLLVEAFDIINYSECKPDAQTTETETNSEIEINLEATTEEDTNPENDLHINIIAESLGKAINLFLTKNQITSSDNILVALPSQFVLSRFVNLPSVGKSQLKEIVKFEVEKHIPININDIIWDFHTLNDKVVLGQEMEVGIFAIKKGDIYTFLSSLQPIENNLTTVQTSSIALYNFLAFNNQTFDPTLLIEIGTENTNLMIIDNDKFWIRNVPSADMGDDFVNEIKRSVGYYKSLVKEIELKYLIIAGNIPQSSQKNSIANKLGYELKEIEIEDNIEFSDTVDREIFDNNTEKLSISLGLTLQGLSIERIRVNLIPEECALKLAMSGKTKLALISSIIILASVFLIFCGQQIQNKRIQEYSTIPIINQIKKIEKKYTNTEKEYNSKISNLQQIVNTGKGRLFWIKIIPKIMDTLPNEIKLFSLQTKWVSTPKNGLLIHLTAKSFSPRLGFIEYEVKKPLEQLVIYNDENKEVPLFTDVNIVPGSIKDDKEGISFAMEWIVEYKTFLLLSFDNDSV